MADPFTSLKERALKLGNHNRKYIIAAEKFKDRLQYHLEKRGDLNKVHLFRPTEDLEFEMDTIIDAGSDEREKLNFLGCYYSLQLLNLNIRNIDVLQLEVLSGLDPMPCYEAFMKRLGVQFRKLTAAYMSRLLRFFVGSDDTEFVILGVGTRADQDDIDVGIVVPEGEVGERFNQAVSRLNNEMLKRASRLHFHLSENVGRKRYYATIPEYIELLETKVHDFVIINEMLGARPILGSERLYHEFIEKVTARYFYTPGETNNHHEGFVRGIVGEIRSLLLQPAGPEIINPKDDALRMIKGLVFVGKTIFGIDAASPWETLREMEKHDPDRVSKYRGLYRALTFIETFRFLYQLYEVQEEEIDLTSDHVTASLDAVAQAMGYKKMGVVPAWHHLVIHYFEFIRLTRMTVESLLNDVRSHLRESSIFTGFIAAELAKPADLEPGENPARAFADIAEFFEGTRFWDDVLRPLGSDKGVLVSRFIQSFQNCDQRERSRLIRRYVSSARYTMFSMISLMMIIYRNRALPGAHELFDEFAHVFLKRLRNMPGAMKRIVQVFHRHPGLIDEFLAALDDDLMGPFMEIIDVETWHVSLQEARDRLLFFCRLHYFTSLYFKRFMRNAFARHPRFILFLQEPDNLRRIAEGFLGEVENLAGPASKKHKLGEYYDLEFLRVGLETLSGREVSETNADFTEFSDNYFQTLYSICRNEVEKAWGKKVPTHDLFAIYAAGGYGREQAYDDDFDLFCLLNSNDPEIKKFCTQIVAKMNKEIIKRGTMPHYRFADHFGTYVTGVDELEAFLDQGGDGVMVECSQLLGSRLVVGSTRFDEEFQQRVIRPYIFDRSHGFIRSLIKEVRSRHEYYDGEFGGNCLNLKECPGGLRDIETLLLLYKALFNIRHNISEQFLLLLGEFDLASSGEIEPLRDSLNFLRNLRDVYRLVVTADDDLHPDYLEEVARILKFEDTPSRSGAEHLLDHYRKVTAKVAGIVQELMAGVLQ